MATIAVPVDDQIIVNPEVSRGYWFLRGDLGCGHNHDVELRQLPFKIGRGTHCDLTVSSIEVSRQHAEFVERAGKLWLRDCGSTNGTYINQRQLLHSQRLEPGDIARFGPLSFEIGFRRTDGQSNTISIDFEPSCNNDATQDLFDTMLRERSVVPYFQPIQQFSDNTLLGYEILGRCDLAGFPRYPSQALQAADSLNRQVELSELFREIGLQHAVQLGNRHTLFLNAAPSEVEPIRLAASLNELRIMAPDLPLVLEINEAAITGHRMLCELRALLADLNVGLAYDDFGVGRARLLEIIEVPPDWLKFDLLLIQSLRNTPVRARAMLSALVNMARALGIRTVAEGIETQEDLDTCREIGFDVGQGYLIGRPMPFLS